MKNFPISYGNVVRNPLVLDSRLNKRIDDHHLNVEEIWRASDKEDEK